MQIDISQNPSLQTALNARMADELGQVMQDKFLLDIVAENLFAENSALKERVAQLVDANTRLNDDIRALRAERDQSRARPKAED
jgi:hypothetical protein